MQFAEHLGWGGERTLRSSGCPGLTSLWGAQFWLLGSKMLKSHPRRCCTLESTKKQLRLRGVLGLSGGFEGPTKNSSRLALSDTPPSSHAVLSKPVPRGQKASFAKAASPANGRFSHKRAAVESCQAARLATWGGLASKQMGLARGREWGQEAGVGRSSKPPDCSLSKPGTESSCRDPPQPRLRVTSALCISIGSS